MKSASQKWLNLLAPSPVCASINNCQVLAVSPEPSITLASNYGSDPGLALFHCTSLYKYAKYKEAKLLANADSLLANTNNLPANANSLLSNTNITLANTNNLLANANSLPANGNTPLANTKSLLANANSLLS